MKINRFLRTLLLVLVSIHLTQAQQTKPFQVLSYFSKIRGTHTLAGIHNREPNANPARWSQAVDSVSGQWPGFWSGDFLFQQDNIQNRSLMVAEAARQWNRGAVVNLIWHACNPALEQPCGWDKQGVLSHLSDDQWTELTTNDTPLNRRWKNRMDDVCIYLQQLKQQGVEVLWRPLHEMNQGLFWWGGRPGRQGTVRLYELMHDYMTREKGLTNLIWVWDIQDFQTLEKDAAAYKPDDQYWDVAALDVYDKSGFTREKYTIMQAIAGSKPIAIGECAQLPDVKTLEQQPNWVFFMGWSELVFQDNTPEQIRQLHAAPRVLTLREMPGWHK